MLKKIVSNVAIIFYALISLEFIFMISPFAIYYYAIYGSVLNKIFVFPYIGWITAFFLPHIALINSPFFITLSFTGPIFFLFGLFIFCICAAQVYRSKIRRKNILVKKGLYSFFKHPQYFGLAISGLGLLLMWPRFFILIMYVTMVFIYCLLAKKEEREIEERFGDIYGKYKPQASNISPKVRIKIFSLFFGGRLIKGWALLILYSIILATSIGIGLALREYTKSKLPITYVNNIVVVPLLSSDETKIKKPLEKILVDEQVIYYLDKYKMSRNDIYIAYILPPNTAKQNYINNNDVNLHLNRTKKLNPNFIFRIRDLHDMLILGPMSRLCVNEKSETRKVIICHAFNPKGKHITLKEALGINIKRVPFLFIDINIKKQKIILIEEIPAWRRNNIIPMPAF